MSSGRNEPESELLINAFRYAKVTIGAGLKVRRRLDRSTKLCGLESSSSDGVNLPPQFET